VTAVQPGGTTSKQQLLREQLEGRSTRSGANVVEAVPAAPHAVVEQLGGGA
jgi:hypothetical protein